MIEKPVKKPTKAVPRTLPIRLPRPPAEMVVKLIQELAGHTSFQFYVEQIRTMREAAIQDLCNDEVVGNELKTAAAIGEIRTFTAILSLTDAEIEKARPVRMDE